MAAKKSSRGSARRNKPQAEEAASYKGSDRLTGAVYHSGRMYDHRKIKDQKEFSAMVDKEGLAESSATGKDRSEQHKARLQALADAGALSGYGTKAAKKAAKGEGDEDTGDSTEQKSADEARSEVEDEE